MCVPRPFSLSVMVLTALVLLSMPLMAAFEIPLAGQLAYGVPHDVAVSYDPVSEKYDYAYVASQEAVSVFDISNTANPIQVAVIDTTGSAEGVAVSGDYLYVADWSAGLRVIDISNPLSPFEEIVVDTPGYAYGVAVAGDKAYVADHAAGLRVFDISNPLAPTPAGSYDTAGYAWDVAVSGGYVFIADGFAGLVVLNEADLTEAATCPATDRILDVAVEGDFAYLADGTAGLKVFQISTLTCAYGELSTTGKAFGVAVDGDFAYLAAGTAGLQVIDVRDPSSPILADSCDTPGRAYAVAVAGDVAYVADEAGGFIAVDVGGSPTPTLVSQAETAGNAEGVAVPDEIAYVADGSGGVDAFNVSDPSSPARVAGYPSGAGTMQAMDVAVSGDYAYVADWNSALKVLDITAAPPSAHGSCAVAGHPNGIAVSGNRAYLAAADAGLVPVDISNPAAPSALSAIDTPGSANDVAVAGNYAFVADGASGLQIIDTTAPTAAMTTVATTGYCWGVDYADGYVYVASGDAGLEVVNVSTLPGAVSKESTLALSGSAHSVAIYGDYAYVSVGGKGVAVVDVTNPALPVHVTTCGTPSVPGPSDLVVAGGYAYVADAESGLVVVDLLPPYTMLARRQSPSLGEKLAVVKQSDGSAVGYVASRSAGLQIVQVSDADEAGNPAFVRSKLGLGDVTDVAVQGAYGYVADSGGRLYLVGLTNATNPSPVGSTLTSGSPHGVAGTTISSGNYALVADGSKGLSVVSTQVAGNPFEKGSFDTPGWCSDVVPAVLDGDPYACVADGESGMRLINLSSIGTPDVTVFSDDFEDGIDEWSTGGTVEWWTGTPRRGTHSVRLRNDGSIQQTVSTVGYSKIWASYYLAATLDTTGSAVTAEWFDGSTWTQLEQIQPEDADEDGYLHPFTHELTTAADDSSSFALRFKLTGSAAGDYGFVDDVIVRSSSSSDPYEVGFVNTPGQARGVAVSGDYAYVADGERGLRVIDITTPGDPLEIGSYDTSGYAESVEIFGRVAIVADGSGGVVLVDCNTPTSPVELASYATYGWATDVDVVQGHAYVVENGWGLTVLRLWYTFKDVLFSSWAFTEIEATVANEITKGYLDELYHPEIVCSRDQMAVFIARALAGGDDLVPTPTTPQKFLDVTSEHWAYKHIEYCAAQGIVEGYVDPRTGGVYYRPLFTVTRDVMAVFMARATGDVMIGEDMDTAGELFLDIPAGYWAGTAIEACIGNGVVKGYDDGYYRPWLAVTRDQMAVFIYRAFDL